MTHVEGLTAVAEPAALRAKAVKPAWLEHFTLGAGDGFNIGIYGHPELSRGEVYIGADGRLNYLQAQGIVATGLTVDELRARLNTELARYYQHAQVVISPITIVRSRFSRASPRRADSRPDSTWATRWNLPTSRAASSSATAKICR